MDPFIVLCILFACLFYYAFFKEKEEQKYSYFQGIPKKTDSLKTLVKRVKICLETDLKTVKWRRSFLGAFLSTILIFLVVHFRIPNFKEMFLYTMIIYVIYYANWHNYSACISEEASKTGSLCLRKILVAKVTT